MAVGDRFKLCIICIIYMKQKVLVSKSRLFSNSRNFNWIPKGNIVGIASDGGSFVNLEGDRKCSSVFPSVEIRDVDLRALVKESNVKGFGSLIKGKEMEAVIDEDMDLIAKVIAEIESAEKEGRKPSMDNIVDD